MAKLKGIIICSKLFFSEILFALKSMVYPPISTIKKVLSFFIKFLSNLFSSLNIYKVSACGSNIISKLEIPIFLTIFSIIIFCFIFNKGDIDIIHFISSILYSLFLSLIWFSISSFIFDIYSCIIIFNSISSPG